ncbi:MAG: hypothetical protein BroJett018_26740 [Chloroflexota bacterium]|nr:MAG: hypothetical protein BroJett018_26740 [Chloroflexota bacterium]
MCNIFFKRPRVFISYRRQSASGQAQIIYERLKRRGVDAFRDTHDINAGRFAQIIQQQINRRHNFVIILTPDVFGSEWVVREIKAALAQKRNIIPVEVGTFKLGSAELPADIAELREFSAIEWDPQYENAVVTRILRALQPPVWLWLSSLVIAVSLFIGIASLVAFLALSSGDDGREAAKSPTPSQSAEVVAIGPSLTPSATLNPTESIATDAAVIVTGTAHADDVGTRVAEIHTEQAATNAYFATQTATFLPVGAGGEGGEGGANTVGETFTPSVTFTPSITPNISETAVFQVDARNTEAWLTVTLMTLTVPPRRVTLTPTPTPTILPLSPVPPNNQQPGATRGPSSAVGSTPTWTPSPTVTVSPTPSSTASVTGTPTILHTPTPSPTAPTLPPTSAYFALPTPAIMSNPSFVVIPVYAGPSESSGIVAFLNHADVVYIYAELDDRGWVFIGFGWVKFDRVLSVGNETDIPIFQTQVWNFEPAPTSEDDFRALGYQMMTLTAGDGGITGDDDEDVVVEPNPGSTPTPTPGLNISQYQTFVAGLTLTAMPTRTPTMTRTIAPTLTRTSVPSATRTPVPTFTRTPAVVVPTSAGELETFNPARFGCVISSYPTINVREQPSTSSAVVGTYPTGSVIPVNGQQSGWYRIGGGWISGEIMVVFATQGEADARCNSVPPPVTPNPNVTPPTSGPPPTPGPSPTPEPFSVQIINVAPGAYGDLNNNQGEPQGCRVNFTAQLYGADSLDVQICVQNGFYPYPGNCEGTVTLHRGDNDNLSATLGGARPTYCGHVVNLVVNSVVVASASATCGGC